MSDTSDNIYKNIRLKGFYSEYLPPCFKLEERMFNYCPTQNCDLIEPYSFTMSRFNKNNSRRTIYIPEFGVYTVLNNFIKDNTIIEELRDFINENSSSFSKVILEDNTIMRHEQNYHDGVDETNKKSYYIDNIVKKIIISAGSKKVLKLDIANCYASLYTHYIPSILLGYDKAEEFYKNKLTNDDDYPVYEKYSELDGIIRKQNKNQTNGLLAGPIFSSLVVEAFLTRIDIELKQEGILFTRYVDDYEIFLNDDSEETVKYKISSILRKYGMSLNYEKIEVIEFPFYVVQDFDRIIDFYRKNKNEDYDLIKLFNDFFEIEKSGTKGAIRYLLKNIELKQIEYSNKNLYNSYILTIMANDSRSLTKTCSLLIKNNKESTLEKEYINQLKDMLEINLYRGNDLEVIWLLYVLIETNNITIKESIVKKILDSTNELCKVMLLRKGFIDDYDIIKKDANSWILNYELYAIGELTEENFYNKLKIDKNKEMYRRLKQNGLHFCYNKID